NLSPVDATARTSRSHPRESGGARQFAAQRSGARQSGRLSQPDDERAGERCSAVSAPDSGDQPSQRQLTGSHEDGMSSQHGVPFQSKVSSQTPHSSKVLSLCELPSSYNGQSVSVLTLS